MTVSPESDLLLRCLRLDEDQREIAILASFFPSAWEATLVLARRLGVAPLLAWKLKTLPSGVDLPEGVRQELRLCLLTSAARNTRLFIQLGQVLPALQRASIPTIVLKGAHLAALVYPDPALRPMADIDLLVRPEHLSRCDQVLCELGYGPSRRPWIERDFTRVHHHLPPYGKPGASPLEIHWSIAQPTSPFQVQVEHLWQNALPSEMAGIPALILSPEHFLLHLCIHTCYDDRFIGKLRPIADVAETLHVYASEIDWEQVTRVAFEWRVTRCAYLTLHLAADLLGAQISADALAALKPVDFDERIAGLAKDKIFAGVKISAKLTQTLEQDTFINRARLILQRLFLPPEKLAFIYSVRPDSPRIYWYYFARLKDLIARYSRFVWQILPPRSRMKESLDREKRLVEWLSAQ